MHRAHRFFGFVKEPGRKYRDHFKGTELPPLAGLVHSTAAGMELSASYEPFLERAEEKVLNWKM